MKSLVAEFLVFLLAASCFFYLSDFANSESGAYELPLLSMPVEYVNYTIFDVNGVLWAKIDGYYPIYILNYKSEFSQMPMVYPTPPNTTNINLKLNGAELQWSNYSSIFPEIKHHTAIGDWNMVYCTVGPISDFFILTIHYEHPVEFINGTYAFLYDLNISGYLSEESNSSQIHYTIRFETTLENICARTTETDTKWNLIDYTYTKENDAEIISIIEHSSYYETLPGDLIVFFNGNFTQNSQSGDNQITQIVTVSGIVLAVSIIVATSLLLYKRKSKTANQK